MMRQYYAPCPLGVEEALAHEVQMIGGENVEIGRGAVEFEGDLRIGYAANLWCRSAIRIQEVLAWRTVGSERDLESLPEAIIVHDLVDSAHRGCRDMGFLEAVGCLELGQL